MSNLKRFEIEIFNKLVDDLISEFNNRFEQIHKFSDMFGFLWGFKLSSMSEVDLKRNAKDLCLVYSDDLDLVNFINEVKYLKFQITPFMPENKCMQELGPLLILNILYANGLETPVPNVVTALRIFLTLPVTVASNERAFSKLKLIKNYLRSSVGQERLTNLSIISIENAIAKNINFDDVIAKFSNVKCRRINVKL